MQYIIFSRPNFYQTIFYHARNVALSLGGWFGCEQFLTQCGPTNLGTTFGKSFPCLDGQGLPSDGRCRFVLEGAGSGRLVQVGLDVKKPWKISGLVGWLVGEGRLEEVGWLDGFTLKIGFGGQGSTSRSLNRTWVVVWPMFRGELLVLGRGTSCGQLDESFKRKKPHHLARSSWLHYRGWKSTMDPSAFAATSRIPCLFRACLTGPTFQPMTLQWPGWILCQKQEGGVVKW